jgi:DNA-binding NarL/FixJ family response regulator
MAGMNGFEAAEQIRQIAPGTKIVIYSMHSVPASARRVGANEFVSKTSAPHELVAAIQRVAKQLSLDSSLEANPAAE